MNPPPIGAGRPWEHPWLRLDRAVRYLVGRRLREGPSERLDRALLALATQQKRLQEVGWFN